VTQLPQHKHLHEESNAKHYIEEKVAPELRNMGKLMKAASRGFSKKTNSQNATGKFHVGEEREKRNWM
jgi:hypothetical protein